MDLIRHLRLKEGFSVFRSVVSACLRIQLQNFKKIIWNIFYLIQYTVRASIVNHMTNFNVFVCYIGFHLIRNVEFDAALEIVEKVAEKDHKHCNLKTFACSNKN